MRNKQRSRPGEPGVIRLGLALAGVAALVLVGSSSVGARELPATNGEPGRALLPAVPGFQAELPGESPTLDITFLFSAVATFSPLDSSTAWSYWGAGCRVISGGTAALDMDLHLPNQAILDYLRVYYYDADAALDVSARLYSFDAAGTATELALAESSGSAGWGDAGSGFFFHRVNNVSESLAIRVETGGASGNIYVCGVRVRYSPALIFADGFETGNTTLWSVAVP